MDEKTLVVTEKRSVADDFAKALGGFRKKDLSYERDDMVIAWASGHLMELQDPSAYDSRFKRWALQDLPIIPERFRRAPRTGNSRSKELLDSLVKQMRRPDVRRIVNACDAGREGELIFNLIAEHAGVVDGGGPRSKPVRRLWLQSMTSDAIRKAFGDLHPSEEFSNLRDAAYARDEADWMVGMNGTRAFTRKFMGRARSFFAVGRVKTPTLAFLVDREWEIDRFRPEPYFQVDATFEGGGATYEGRWNGVGPDGRKTDRLGTLDEARAILEKVRDRPGVASDKTTKRTEIAPLLFDLTSLQREASNRFGYTLDRTLSLAQSLYETRKAITYPRTSSRYLPTDYAAEVPKLVSALRTSDFSHVVARALSEAGGSIDQLRPVKRDRVFNDKKVSDHFALIPTGELPANLRDDERKVFELILRRFLAVLLPPAKWENVTRTTEVEGETFVTRQRRLVKAGWRAVEPVPGLDELPPLPEGGAVATRDVEVLEKETQPPARYTDGSLVKAMETSGRELTHDVAENDGELLDDEQLEELKEKGIGTPATRAAIVQDLVQKGLARRQGRSILPTPLGCNLVRLVRNLDLDVLAKPDLTGTWEYRLAQMTDGAYPREQWDTEIRDQVATIVDAVKDLDGGSEEVLRRDHPGPLPCPSCGALLVEKTFSYMCPSEGCEVNVNKDQRGKYVFPTTLQELLARRRVGPLTGFERTRAPGFLTLDDSAEVHVELQATGDDEEEEEDKDTRREEVPDGLVAGSCPKCGSPVRRAGRGYRCDKNVPRKKDKECDFRLAERIKYRYLPLEEVRKLLAGEKTDELFGFVSARGRKFRARLYYEDGDLKWQFPERKKKTKKKKKKAAKKKATRRTTRKTTAGTGGKAAKTSTKSSKKATRKTSRTRGG